MATISFWGHNSDVNIQNLSGSGLGFYGVNFGTSVNVNAYQDSTWVTDGNGVTQGPQVHNAKWIATTGVKLDTVDYPLLEVANYLATLKIRFEHTSAVKTQNARFYVYDRTSINNPPSGVTCKVGELVHPWLTATPAGSGSTVWETPAGSSYLALIASPGYSGYRPNGPDTTDTVHDWYLIISASPDSIGSKTKFGGYFETEYL